jgi:hypothetical protein
LSDDERDYSALTGEAADQYCNDQEARAPRRGRHAQGRAAQELPEGVTGLIPDRKRLKGVSRHCCLQRLAGRPTMAGTNQNTSSDGTRSAITSSSIGFALTRSRGLLHRLLKEHAPDDARRVRA